MRQEAARRRLDSMDIAAAADAAAGAADDPDEVRCALPSFRRHQRISCMCFGSVNLCRHRHRRCKITQTRCWAPRSSASIVNGLLFGKSALQSACTIETVHTTPAYPVVSTLPGNPAAPGNVHSASGRAGLARSMEASVSVRSETTCRSGCSWCWTVVLPGSTKGKAAQPAVNGVFRCCSG